MSLSKNGSVKALGVVLCSAFITIIGVVIIAILVKHDVLPVAPQERMTNGPVPVTDQDKTIIQQFERQ